MPDLKGKIETPIFHCHGEDDQMISFERGKLTSEALSNLAPNYEFHSFPWMGHEANQEEMDLLQQDKTDPSISGETKMHISDLEMELGKHTKKALLHAIETIWDAIAEDKIRYQDIGQMSHVATTRTLLELLELPAPGRPRLPNRGGGRAAAVQQGTDCGRQTSCPIGRQQAARLNGHRHPSHSIFFHFRLLNNIHIGSHSLCDMNWSKFVS